MLAPTTPDAHDPLDPGPCTCICASASASTPATETINPLHLTVRQLPNRGRGVFASRAIPAGEVLEEAPVLVITQEEWDGGRMNDSVLGEYGFCWSRGGMGIGLGIASLFNHSSSPNVNFIRNFSTNTITFRTIRRVAVDEELCICYSADESKLWFVPSAGRKAEAALSDDEGDGSAALAKLGLGLGGDSDSDDEARAERERKALVRAERKRNLKLGLKLAHEDSLPTPPPTADTEPSGTAAAAPTRREQGGNTHAARERRREKYKIKMEAQAEAAKAAERGGEATAPAPTPAPTTTTHTETTTTTTTTLDPLPGVLAAAPVPRHRRPVVNADLPPPAHEYSRHKHTGPVVLTDDLLWEPEDGKNVPAASWGLLRRARGPVEIEEEEEADNSATIPVWVVEIADPKLTRSVLDYVKDIESDPRMRHLKRVRRTRDDAGEHTYIALSMADEAGPTADELASSLEEFNPVLAALAPIVVAVPKHAAKTPEQLKARGALWPVTFSPQAPRPGDARAFTPAKLAWVREGIARVLADAAVAKAAGELPVAVFCTSPPEALWPHDPNSVAFIPPTPGLRAAGHDSRTSEAHPLRHAAFNCIARIARLRTVPPFSEVQSKVNGADYLLTSMSLFTTHEPCTMCAMALLHSRVREVFYVHARPRSGGLESSFGVHSTKVLNHRFEAWKWCGEVPADEVDGSVEI